MSDYQTSLERLARMLCILWWIVVYEDHKLREYVWNNNDIASHAIKLR